MQLPEQQPTRPGQPDPVMKQALQIAAAVNEAFAEKQTAVRIDDPDVPSWADGARIGTAPPVPQPGQPPMSQWATDASGVLKAVGVVSLPVGGAFWIVGQVEPLTLGIICGTPIALALAVGRLVGRVKAVVEAAPPTNHHHYNGPVTQDSRSITTTTRGVIANTRNQG
ncbi:hypothetical protein [Streptomyces sp. NBC_01022]|uniref:hypothetical protein n=1 Tax=Streptomyces sp. NBC_01022 TaxID=2903723 RepID=UPI002DD833A4|nr:hypothetical protein [Streptomyces sp. NBC_01022]WRZ84838.1 hypothetical protein OG316_33545 [Streptomyces sp. NBC_01022]